VPVQLLAEAVDDQQRVVDRDPEPDQLDQVRDVGRHRQPVRKEVDEAERAHDRAGGEQERDRHRPRQPEHQQQDPERNRDRDQELALPQVLVEDRVQVVLDRSLAGHVGRHPVAPREGAQDTVRVALRVGDAQRRDDVAVQHMGATRREREWTPRRHLLGRASHRRLQPATQCRIGRVGNLQDDRERAVAAVAVVVLEDRAGPLGVGARHREGVREQRRELPVRVAAGEQDGEPHGYDEPAVTQYQAGPTLHGG
jgi:hypothetical protein